MLICSVSTFSTCNLKYVLLLPKIPLLTAKPSHFRNHRHRFHVLYLPYEMSYYHSRWRHHQSERSSKVKNKSSVLENCKSNYRWWCLEAHSTDHQKLNEAVMESAYHGANWYALVVSNKRHYLKTSKFRCLQVVLNILTINQATEETFKKVWKDFEIGNTIIQMKTHWFQGQFSRGSLFCMSFFN